jgi:signal transduction histidine kinase
LELPVAAVSTLAILPLGIALGWWLGWRFVKPIEQMRAQLIAKAATAAPGADVDVGGRRDEFGDLTSAFNLLLGALDERRKANEAFVADLAHEFKNPVAAIRAAADALGPGAVDETRAARLQTALKDSSRRLDSLLTQFLELARAEAGMPREPRSVVELAPLIEGVVAGFTADERFKQLRFSVERSDARVVGVPERLEAALRNLVDNAASFARSEVKVAFALDARTVAIQVQDDGPGIPAEDLPKVFDRFFTSRRHQRGTGLGLALVRAVVEAHGGAVVARSIPGQGATFEIRLPRTEAPAERGPLRATG